MLGKELESKSKSGGVCRVVSYHAVCVLNHSGTGSGQIGWGGMGEHLRARALRDMGPSTASTQLIM